MRTENPDCAWLDERLEAYELKLLDDAEAQRSDEHLAACGSCRERLAEVQRTVRLLERLPERFAGGGELGVESVGPTGWTANAPRRARWIWAVAALWLLSVSLGAAALLAALRREPVAPVAVDPLAGILERIEAQEKRLVELSRPAPVVAPEPRGPDLAPQVDDLWARLAAQEAAVATLREENAALRRLGVESQALLEALVERDDAARAERRQLAELAAALDAHAKALALAAERLDEVEKRVEASARRSEAALASRRLAAPAVEARSPVDAAWTLFAGIVEDGGRGVPDKALAYRDQLLRMYRRRN
jgi:DNA repair exonuclease SbcCD ATPase subunit